MRETQKDRLKDVAQYLVGIQIEVNKLRLWQPKTPESEEAHAQTIRFLNKAQKVLKEIYGQ